MFTIKRKIVLIAILSAASLFAQSIQYTAYVKVVSSIPEYENSIESTPIKECWDERVPVTYYTTERSQYRNDNTAAAVLGGVAGGVLGHQIGKGRGKDVATIGGAILGTIAGGNMASENRYDTAQRVPHTRYETKRHCTTKYDEKRVRNFIGYKNVGYYKGKKIVKYSDRKLRNIPITVTISY